MAILLLNHHNKYILFCQEIKICPWSLEAEYLTNRISEFDRKFSFTAQCTEWPLHKSYVRPENIHFFLFVRSFCHAQTNQLKCGREGLKFVLKFFSCFFLLSSSNLIYYCILKEVISNWMILLFNPRHLKLSICKNRIQNRIII